MQKLGLGLVSAVAACWLGAGAAQAACNSTLPAGGAFSSGSFAPLAAGGTLNSLTGIINAANTTFLNQSTDFLSNPMVPQPGQALGSVWARGMGGGQTTKGTASSTYGTAGGLTGATTCSTSTTLNFGGVQIGTDLSSLSYGGWDAHVGSSVGYLGATTKDSTSPGPANPFGGSLNNNLQIPFVGLYGVATHGNFFLSGAARWLYIQNSLTDAQDGMFGQHFDARGVAINGTLGYTYNLPNNWFIQPSAGFIWSETQVDPFNTPGTFALGTGPALPGRVDINDIHSAIVRGGARIGTVIDTGNILLEPYGAASVFHEFEGGASGSVSTITSVAGVPAAAGFFSTSSVGTYGQFGLGLSGAVKNTGWTSFVRADYRTGDNIQGWDIAGGVRYQFAQEKMAWPGMPLIPFLSPEPAALAKTSYDWTGFRVGAQLGADWGYTNWSIAGIGSNTTPHFAGVLPGGFIGYDYQIGRWVVGAGADMSWNSAHGAAPCPTSTFVTCENKSDWFATATARVGYVFWGDRVLTYGKAGLALADFKVDYSCATGGAGAPGVAGCPGAGAAKTSAGWTIGGGTELALLHNWSVRAETSYFDLGTDHYAPSLGGTALPVDVRHNGFLATIGVAYRFGAPEPAPVVSKY
jgi:opacity protein-like surface antigen